MDTVFLPGPFAAPAMLRAILGPDIAVEQAPARLAAHALRLRGDSAALCLVPDAGRSVAGVLLAAAPPLRDRIGFALAAFGAEASPVTVTVEGADDGEDGPRPALVWRAPEAPSWPLCPEAPGDEWHDHLVEAAAEVMAHHPRLAAAAARALMPGISYRALARVRGAASDVPQGPRSGLTRARDVETLAVERPYAAYFAVEEHRLRHRRFDGRWSPELTRAAFLSGDAVTLLPFDPRRRSVLLIEQFRVGPLARRDPQPWFLEPVAGRCDAGETVEATARREAREEAGLDLGRIERVAGYYPSPGITAEHITSFVGEADLGAAGGVHGLDSEDEDIRTLVLPLDEALALMRAGVINNAPLLVTLLWLAAEAEHLAERWGAP
jgi:nudix-type nucleoside diphosphatase (YffH/AdpP family)